MALNRNQFILLLLGIAIGPFVAYKIIWLTTSKQTTGIMCFTGHSWDGNWITSHPVIKFEIGGKTIFFNGNLDLGLKEGEIVPVRYQKDNPPDAKVNKPIYIWGDTLVYALFPFLILLILFLTPDRFDPVIPKKSKVLLGKKPFIRILR